MKFGKKKMVALGVSAALLAFTTCATACTSIHMGKLATKDGSVMTAHTCDGWYDARTWVVPGGTHEPGETHTVYSNYLHDDRVATGGKVAMAEIPQVEETYTYFHVAYPYMNDQGVIMGETTISGRRELRGTDGIFYIEALQILGLQRGATAREAIQVMGALAEEYGYIDSGECLTVGDQNEMWIFEIFGTGPIEKGAVWAAVRIPDDHVSVSANRSRIGTIDFNDKDNYMYSSNITQVAIDNGWWDPNSGEEFVFYDAYGPSNSAGCKLREWRALSWAAPSLNLDPNANRYPLSVKAEWKIGVEDMMAIYRDHYEGTEFDKAAVPGWYVKDRNGNTVLSPYATPNVGSEFGKLIDGYIGSRNISIPGCSYFTILQSRSWMDPKVGTLCWFGLNNTDTSTYVPIYAGVSSLPENYAVNDRTKLDFDNYKESAWWAFDFVDNLVNMGRYQEAILDVRAARAPFEAEQFALQPVIEKAASDLLKVNPELGVQFLTDYTNGRAEKAVELYWTIAEDLIVKYDDKGF